MSQTTEHEVTFGPSPLPVESVVVPVSRTAQLLALAIRFERLLQTGEVESMAKIARRYGVSRVRVSQLMNLLNLAPVMQESTLLGQGDLPERAIRVVAGESVSENQTI